MELAVVGKQLTMLCLVLRLRSSSEKDGLLETGQLSILAMERRTLGKEKREGEEEGPGGERETGEEGHKGPPLIIWEAGKFGVVLLRRLDSETGFLL